MNQDPVDNKLRELLWRRNLTAAEAAELRAHLAAHPEAQTDWELEEALSEGLARLPDAPVPSNFTARVLQAVERDAAQRERERAPLRGWHWRVFVPRFAAVVALVGLGWFAYQRFETAQRAAMARSLAAVSEVKSLPSPQVLADFDAIRRLGQAPRADTELLALLQ